MFELLTATMEALAGLATGSAIKGKSLRNHRHLVTLSVAIGCVFFLLFGVYEFLSPAPRPHPNMWRGLLLISLGLSICTYLFLLLDYIIRKRRMRQEDTLRSQEKP